MGTTELCCNDQHINVVVNLKKKTFQKRLMPSSSKIQFYNYIKNEKANNFTMTKKVEVNHFILIL